MGPPLSTCSGISFLVCKTVLNTETRQANDHSPSGRRITDEVVGTPVLLVAPRRIIGSMYYIGEQPDLVQGEAPVRKEGTWPSAYPMPVTSERHLKDTADAFQNSVQAQEQQR